MDTRTRIILATELATQGLSVSAIARQLGRHRETIGLWLTAVGIEGLPAFLDRYAEAKTGPRRARQVPGAVKRLVWAIRAREHDCCGQKIQYVLAHEQHIHLSVPKIYEILAERYVLRPRGRTNQPRGVVPIATAPRAVIQMDTVVVGEVFAFTGVDIYTKEADVVLQTELTSEDGAMFVRTAMTRRFTGPVQIIQTDGGSEFKGIFAQQVLQYCVRHRIARPYKKNEQAYIESFNRTLRKECLGWTSYRVEELPTLQGEGRAFLDRYHDHRPHLGLFPMRPPLAPSGVEQDGLSDIYGE
jgi:transposase